MEKERWRKRTPIILLTRLVRVLRLEGKHGVRSCNHASGNGVSSLIIACMCRAQNYRRSFAQSSDRRILKVYGRFARFLS